MINRHEGPEFLIIDNFAEYFELDLSDLINARNEAEEILVRTFENGA